MTEDMEKSEVDPMTRKIFYLFENDQAKNNVKGYKSKKKGSKKDNSRISETNSNSRSSKSSEQ